MEYSEFLHNKTHLPGNFGFEPTFMPDMLFDFQQFATRWACMKGRGALFFDCGSGKTLMQLVHAENVARHTGKRVLILTPLAVSSQTVEEGEKIGVEVIRRRGPIERNDRIVVSNYQMLHHFNPQDFVMVVCDESSILKNYTGATSKAVIRFINKIQYRLLCTATASPNDYPELGTSSEALGDLSYSDMLTRFFRQLDDKGQKKERRLQEREEKANHHYQRLAFRVSQSIGQWRLKHHAVNDFWRWVSSWALASRHPSDLGFLNGEFVLPELIQHTHIVKPSSPADGFLFTLPAMGLKEEREERKRTLHERVDMAAALVNDTKPAVIWCHYNSEGDALEKAIPGGVQVAGSTPDEKKEGIYQDFKQGNIRVLITKPKIGAWGLNWQHCSHVVSFATHSYEQDYQSVRRCWRFGQKHPVVVDRILSEGESRVIDNLERKAMQAEVMFEKMIACMGNSKTIKNHQPKSLLMEVPTWL